MSHIVRGGMGEDSVSDAVLVPVSMKRMMSVMVMALVLFVSCQDATPTPLPTPVSYNSLYTKPISENVKLTPHG